MKLRQFRVVRTWNDGETTQHLFAGDAETDRYIEVNTLIKSSQAEELSDLLTGKGKKFFPMAATESYLRQSADSITELTHPGDEHAE